MQQLDNIGRPGGGGAHEAIFDSRSCILVKGSTGFLTVVHGFDMFSNKTH